MNSQELAKLIEEGRQSLKANWETGDATTDPMQGDRHYFANLRLTPVPVTKSWEKGEYFELDWVFNWAYNEEAKSFEKDGLKRFGGWKAGGTNKIFVLVATMLDRSGNEYQKVQHCPNQPTRKDEKHFWLEFYLPAIKKTFGLAGADELMADNGVWVEFDDLASGETFKMKDKKTGEFLKNDDGTDKLFDRLYWGNFTWHKTKVAYDEAREKWQAQFGQDDTASSFDHYPVAWKDDPAMLKPYLLDMNGKDHKTMATEAFIIGASGEPTDAIGGGKVEPAKLMSELLSLPEPMIKI